MIMCRYIIITFLALSFLSCERSVEKNSPQQLFTGKNISSDIKYAELFDVYKTDGVRKIVIHSPFSDTVTAAVYYLADSANYEKYRHFENVLPFPLTNIAVLSSTQLSGIDKLGLLDVVSGIADERFIKNRAVRQRIDAGKIAEVSVNGQLFVEKTVMLNPQVVFYSPFQQGQSLPVKGNIKIVPFFDFMEASPLGRAEWIKFTAAFTGNEPVADTIFSAIENDYLLLKQKVSETETRPTVFSGEYFNGQWLVSGGKSYMAQLFKDAGASYVWKDDASRSTIALDFEVVLQKAQDADYWRLLGGVPENDPYNNMLKKNGLYTHFKAFKEHHIVYCNPAATAYFERANLEPQVVLKDFIRVFHPQLLPGYQPVYYRLLP
jgi:iron complex transport system substrate-binding protein